MKTMHWRLFGLIGFFWLCATAVFAESSNTVVVLRDGNQIHSLYFDVPLQYTEEGLPLHDSSRRLLDLNIAAFRFDRDGKRFFVPIEEARDTFESVVFLGMPDPSQEAFSLAITPKKGKPFEVQKAVLIRHVGDEYPAEEMDIEKYMAHGKIWQQDFLSMADVQEIHFVSREKKEAPVAEERVLVGAPIAGDGYSVAALTDLLLAMAKTGGNAGRLSFDIRFDVNSATLTSASRLVLDRLSGALRDPRLGSTRFRLGGHADSTGSGPRNLTLSRKRANSVRSYLVQQGGIDAYRLQSEGYGDTQPVASNKTSDGRRSNRRVEISFLPAF